MDQIAARVAVVDDEESIRKSLLRLFRLTNYRAEAFGSASDLLESLPDRKPDCIILDLQMPGMTGLEFLELMSRMTDPPPVIVITADDAQHTQDECRALGTRHYLLKPVNWSTLLAAVRDVVKPIERPNSGPSFQ